MKIVILLDALKKGKKFVFKIQTKVLDSVAAKNKPTQKEMPAQYDPVWLLGWLCLIITRNLL